VQVTPSEELTPPTPRHLLDDSLLEQHYNGSGIHPSDKTDQLDGVVHSTVYTSRG